MSKPRAKKTAKKKLFKVIYWNVLYQHSHGFESFPMFAHECKDSKLGPSEEEAFDVLGINHELTKDEWVEISDRQETEIPLAKL